MQYESLATDLKAWLTESIERGCAPGVIEQSMRAAGWSPNYARQAVELAFARVGVQPPQSAAPAPVEGGARAEAQAAAGVSSSQILAVNPNAVQTSDRRVEMLFALHAPRVVLFGGLLSAEECDGLVAEAAPKLARSTVVNKETGSFDVHPHRTSSGAYFRRGETELVARIERRISELLGYPVEHGEPIQVLHYLPGAEYKPHFDYFDPALPGNDQILKNGGQRVATLVMYLNDVDAGGSTVFPEVGLDVLPRKGNAAFFAYKSPDGQLDARSLHGGSPVAAGEKWIATKWLRERPYV